MAKSYDLEVDGHPNIYNNYSPRKFKVYFSEPEGGVNSNTGILLFIAGFGGHANSNVYKKMRKKFADEYNLVTVQCDYFGFEFMQEEPLSESLTNFNDMGIMQALDNLTSLIIIEEIIKSNGYLYDKNKIIIYGHSHGSYLSYLCNYFAPQYIDLIIDNSAWVFPVYLKSNRLLKNNGKVQVFEYIAKTFLTDTSINNLLFLYRNFQNNAVIHSFHGEQDQLISLTNKRKLCLPMKRCFLHEITQTDVDEEMIFSSGHGLEADFLKLFDHVWKKHNFRMVHKKKKLQTRSIKTPDHRYKIVYDNVLPVFKRY
ncbi:DUF2920 family protein [Salimicrobium halophilum]|uniref:Alpha/beta hydrolase family protein n=1 Tax=Salimicrobium halophilum TaxID=86666 RepID=A0A1G8V376_9BACI|nr:DUF2920 family protein [Salimicrobium halophilum]SDJ60532.1 Protein of unknown function [Salimicrobium halophilum]